MNGKRVGVVMGGNSSEREVSLRSGQAVARALAEAGGEVVEVVLGRDGNTLQAVQAAKLDLAVLALHGKYGEDGCVQGLLEMLKIPYTGSGVLASALAMDKLKSKELFRLHNIPTPPYYALNGSETEEELEEAHGSFGFPAIVKPRREGSSVGLSLVNDRSELTRAVRAARRFDSGTVVERYVRGQELAVAILDGRVLGAIEVAPKSELYDYTAKYTAGMTEYFLPARLSPTRIRGVLNLAERAVEAVGARGAVRVDLIATEGQNEYVLEVNTLPGMTPTSLFPKIAAAAGYSFEDLCQAIAATARLDSAPASAPSQSTWLDEDEQGISTPSKIAAETAVESFGDLAEVHSGTARGHLTLAS